MSSMWSIPDVSSIKTPLTILREQANHLTNQTDGLIVGMVETSGSGDNINNSFKFVVPSLNRYTYVFLKYNHELISMYPGVMISVPENRGYQVRDEKSFNDTLNAIISSETTALLVKSLLAQAAS